jgi:cytochrome c peroxidase
MNAKSQSLDLHLDIGRATRGYAAVPFTGLRAKVGFAAGVVFTVATAGLAVLPPVPQPAQNPITEEKRVLGKILFFDEQLSTSNVVSCATCHSLAQGGADNRIARNPGPDNVLNTVDDILGSAGIIRSNTSNDYQRDAVFGLAPQITGRAANSPINAAFSQILFWDGRATSQFVDPQTGQVRLASGGALESQAVAPVTNNVEMAHAGLDWPQVIQKLARVRPLDLASNLPGDVADVLATNPSYPELFRRAFGDDGITATRIAFAIATYERTLISNDTPFDRFRAGVPNAMTPQQVQGLNAFQASNCNACHSLAQDLTTDNTFRNLGLRPVAEDNGRQAITGNPADRGKFKVPALRNVGLKRTFMHNGMFQNLNDVLAFYARAPGAPIPFQDNRDPILNGGPNGVNVPPQAVGPILTFLTSALLDQRVANATFPFDRATLFTNRPAEQATVLGGGVAGSGSVVPRIIVQAPPVIGNMEFRIGVDGTLGGASARLGVSSSPPVNGRITPTRFFDAVIANGTGSGAGTATLHWPLAPGVVEGGQVLFAQWFVTDPAAPGAQALSQVARIPFACGRSGCNLPCDSLDFNNDGSIDPTDVDAYFSILGEGPCVANEAIGHCADLDYNNDGNIDPMDVDAYFSVLGDGPCLF